MFAAEQEADIGFAEVVPADDGGKGEEGQTDGEQLRTETREGFVKRQLGNCSAGFAGQIGIGQQDNQRGCRADHQRIDKNTDKCSHTLLYRVFDVGGRMSVWGRTHTGFIGKQAACHTEADCLAHTDTGRTAQYGFRIEGSDKNIVEHRNDVVGEFEQNNHRAQNVNHRHKRHDKLRDTGNAVDAADDDQAGEYSQSNADSHRRNIESQIHGRGDGVGLGRITDETQRDNQGDGEKAGQETRRATADFRS